MVIDDMGSVSKNNDAGDFVALLASHQARIYSYILSLVPNFNEADDLLQETTKLMWEKFDNFTRGTNFQAWGKKIAYFVVLAHCRKKKKENAFSFDERLVDDLAQETEKTSDSSREYLSYLAKCVKKLEQKDKKLLKLRYFENIAVSDISQHLNFSVQYIYRNISRIHQLLLSCVQKQIN